MDIGIYGFVHVGFRSFGCTGVAALIIAPHVLFLAKKGGNL